MTYAIENNSPEIVKILLSKGASIQKEDVYAAVIPERSAIFSILENRFKENVVIEAFSELKEKKLTTQTVLETSIHNSESPQDSEGNLLTCSSDDDTSSVSEFCITENFENSMSTTQQIEYIPIPKGHIPLESTDESFSEGVEKLSNISDQVSSASKQNRSRTKDDGQ